MLKLICKQKPKALISSIRVSTRSLGVCLPFRRISVSCSAVCNNSSKSKLDLGKILTLAAALLALVAFFMMFAPAITSGTDISYTGLQVAFGYTSKSEILGSTVSTSSCAASNAVKYTRLLFFKEYGHKRRQARENAEYTRENSAVGKR